MTIDDDWRTSPYGGDGILFMKVGTHANETLEDIITRKQREIEEAGFALWGYGGNTCHPTSIVQPFASALASRGSRMILAMHPMKSNHFAEPLRARQFSVDGSNWDDIPEAVNALGSRYALWVASLEPVQLELPLDRTRVAWGPSAGRNGVNYVKGRVDKAVLEFDPSAPPTEEPQVEIGLVARVVDPFAVFLRG